jgi:hypothetical protein
MFGKITTMHLAVFMVLAFWPQISWCQVKVLEADSVKQSKNTSCIYNPEKLNGHAVDLNVYFMATGMYNVDNYYSIRVMFLLSEIYFSVGIEYIKPAEDEMGDPEIVDRIFINGFEIGDQCDIPLGRLVSLKFIEWTSWNEFILDENGYRFRIKYLPEGQVVITAMTG